MRRTAAMACNVLGLVLILGVVLLCLPLTLPRLLGYEAFAIVSGSMEPAIPTGSIVYAKAVDPKELAAGDVAVFYTGDAGAPVTHRVVENRPSDAELITKGDANEDKDLFPVPYYQVVGRVALHLPALGLFLPAFASTGGKICLLGFLLAGVLFKAVAARLRPE